MPRNDVKKIVDETADVERIKRIAREAEQKLGELARPSKR